MAQYRKKPVVIEARQWTGENVAEIADFLSPDPYSATGFVEGDGAYVKIATLEGTMKAAKGDWIIRGVKGEFYPCKPDIFAATYEAAD